MSKRKETLEPCKYLDSSNECPHAKEFEAKLDELMAQGKDIGALQPRCPKDAQRNKRGLNCCWCKKGDILC